MPSPKPATIANSAVDKDSYAIGEVARLTGLSVHNLRAWEKRYGAVAVRRKDGGHRSYSPADIERLLLLKTCAERGHRIRDIASLSDEELKGLAQRAQQTRRDAMLRRRESLDTVIFSDQEIDAASLPVPVINVSSKLEDIERLLADGTRILLVVLESITAQAGSQVVSLMNRYRPAVTAVVYYFSDSQTLTRLKQAGADIRKAPTDYADLFRDLLDVPDADAPAVTWSGAGLRQPPVFSRQQLANIASLQTKLQCECPRHLTEIIRQLSAFERYSLECLVQDDEDVAVHEALADAGAHARSTIEQALAFLLEQEKIDPEDWQ